MALKKKIELPNGVTAEYHRITNVNISLELKAMDVVVSSYVSEKFRDEEKDYVEKEAIYNDLLVKLNEELSKETPDEKKVQKIQTKMYENTPVWKDNKVYSQNIMLPMSGTTQSEEDLYTKLKETETFSDAEDLK